MPGKIMEIRLGECVPAYSTIKSNSFATQFLRSDKRKSLRLSGRFQIFFQLLGGHPPDPPLLNLLPNTVVATIHTHFSLPLTYMQNFNVQ